MKKWKKELLEWGIMLGMIGLFYVTGWHTPVIGFLQRGLLKTGLLSVKAEKMALGKANYNFTLLSAKNGNAVSFEQWKGKTIFLNFWATWCPPCIAEMPDIEALFQANNSEKLVLVLIATDKEKEKVVSFLKKKGYEIPVYFLPGALPNEFNSSSIPTTFLISPDGEIVFRHEGMANYNQPHFKKLLNQVSGEKLFSLE